VGCVCWVHNKPMGHLCVTMLQPGLQRRAFGAGIACIAGVLAMPALGALNKPELTRVLLAVSGRSSLSNLPLTIAAQLGYFESVGLQVDFTDALEEPQVQQAVGSGAAQVGAGMFDHTLYLQSKGQPCRAFVLMARSPQVALGVARKSLAWYRHTADLKGCVIGVPASVPTAGMVARLVLLRAGLGPADVSIIEVDAHADVPALLRQGVLDVISHTDPMMTMLEQRGEISIIADTRTLKGTTELFGGVLPSSCLYVTQEFMRRNPLTVQSLCDAVVRALKWLQTAGPGDILKTVPEAHLAGDRALFLAAVDRSREAISPDGLMPDGGPRTARRVLGTLGVIARPELIDLSRAYTNEFAERAKEKFRA